MKQKLSMYFFGDGKTNIINLGKNVKGDEKEKYNGYGHTKRKAPLLVRSVKLNLFGLG